MLRTWAQKIVVVGDDHVALPVGKFEMLFIAGAQHLYFVEHHHLHPAVAQPFGHG
jgi:hypothetical protein